MQDSSFVFRFLQIVFDQNCSSLCREKNESSERAENVYRRVGDSRCDGDVRVLLTQWPQVNPSLVASDLLALFLVVSLPLALSL